MRMTQVARTRSSDLRLEATQLITPRIRRTTEEEAVCTLTDSDGLDAHIDFDSNEDVGEDFFYDTIVEEFEDDATTPFEQGSSEIDIYLLEANVRTKGDFDILQWWKMNSDRFEVIGHMARDILAIPISIVVSESAFNTGGTAQTVDALICIQNWLNFDPIDLQVQHELEEA
ncbi:transposase [Cucumis melo var. makuwa]|uniref:Transposase n=1 Tax=Cucumis melo var. makuwa TaxID=1194695 RepID=A0A5A7TS85_CUCMM|nr:transposase [Cucumis melo var. makuwa]